MTQPIQGATHTSASPTSENPAMFTDPTRKSLPPDSAADPSSNPCVLGYTYEQMRELNSISVSLLPENKGIFLKHREYEISSERHRSKVLRRFNDFVTFHEMLLYRFPYRAIPRLPPRGLNSNSEFLESRRKRLARFLNQVARHPTIAADPMLSFFLTFTGSDCAGKLKEQFKHAGDEFIMSPLGLRGKELVPMDASEQFARSRSLLLSVLSAVSHMKSIVEENIIRSKQYAIDMVKLGKLLSDMSKDSTNVSSWAAGSDDTWHRLKKGLRVISVQFTSISSSAERQAESEFNGTLELLEVLIEMLDSYRDLCERHERGVISDHKQTLGKLKQGAKYQNGGSGEHMHRHTIEQRNLFSLYCIQMETQLCHTYLTLIHRAVTALCRSQGTGASQLSSVWNDLLPSLGAFAESANNNGLSHSNSSSPRSSGFGL